MPDKVETLIRPLLGENVTIIHPAIDIFDDKAAVGVWLPSEITEIKHKEGKDDEVKKYRKMYPYYITDKREIIALDDTLKNNGYLLACDPIQIAPRWDLKDVEDFIRNESPPPNPWEVFKELVEIWAEHVDFEDPREYLFRALWDMGTYFTVIFQTYIYDYLGGVRRTGKTTTLLVHSCLAFNAIGSANISTSSIYRMVQNARCTLCIDETEMMKQRVSDKMSERTYDMRNLLLAGYKKGMPVYRSEKREKTGKIIPEPFEVFGPKALANILGVESVLEDRCKKTIMRRAVFGRIKKNIDLSDPRWGMLRNKLYRLFLTYWPKVKEIYSQSKAKTGELSEPVNRAGEGMQNEKDARLYGREQELWKPIMTMALFVGEHAPTDIYEMFGECSEYINNKTNPPSLTQFTSSQRSLPELIFSLAKDSLATKQAEDLTEEGEIVLMKVLLRLTETPSFEDRYWRVQEIRNNMNLFYDEEQKWITSRWIGAALRRLGFTDSRRLGTGYQYKLTKEKITDTAKRLGVKLEEPPTDNTSSKPVGWLPCDFRVDVPQLVGIDPETNKTVDLGPFTRGQVASLPAQNALSLERKGMVKVIRDV